MSATAPLLVVCHEATRTGASRVILDLLTASRHRLPAPLTVRLLAGGPLAPALLALAEVEDHHGRPAAVLINSALALDAAVRLPDVPMLVYIHEEADALAGLAPDELDLLRERDRTRVLCVSDTSRSALVSLGVEDRRIGLLPPVVPVPAAPDERELRRTREQLGVTDRRLVVGCGVASWRKGTDLFAEVAGRLGSLDDTLCAWVGRRPRGFARRLDHDAPLIGGHAVHWTGDLADTRAHLAAADVVLMPSREDPQPIVPIEAAHLGTPTVGFDVGGLRDLAADGAAVTVPYPDTAALADAVAALLDHRDADQAAEDLVAAARRRGAAQLPESVVPTFVAALRDLFKGEA